MSISWDTKRKLLKIVNDFSNDLKRIATKRSQFENLQVVADILKKTEAEIIDFADKKKIRDKKNLDLESGALCDEFLDAYCQSIGYYALLLEESKSEGEIVKIEMAKILLASDARGQFWQIQANAGVLLRRARSLKHLIPNREKLDLVVDYSFEQLCEMYVNGVDDPLKV